MAINDGLSIDELGVSTEQGQKVIDRQRYLDMYGIDGKALERNAISVPSVVTFGKGEAISRREFFNHKNPVSSLPNMEFPTKTQALQINALRVDVDLNLGATKQESLEREYYFLKNSVLKTVLNKVEGSVIPLEHCVPYVIEYDGETAKYTKKVVRDGFELPAAIQINRGGDFEVSIDPAPGYVTDTTLVNPDPSAENSMRVTLMGISLRARIQG